MEQSSPESQQLFKKAKEVVFRSLKYRPRSVFELQKKLREKGFPDPVIEETIRYFKTSGLIDDRQFSIGWTRSRLGKPLGLRRIKQELKHKGIDTELIDHAVETATDLYNEADAVRSIILKRKNKYRGLDRQTVRRRLFGYLSRRGFQTQTIIKELNQVVK
ncbi:MAG TPA: regulatory protein RecX [Candidatus Omnitrophota bacterium]|nr:regulatory protein RecX [Candidatus Omnitrophota bacterium]HSA31043.1 regulatory protein RecX [Candidatus Omnitrophota bacterium]